MNKVWCFDLWNTLIESVPSLAPSYEDVLVREGVNRQAIFPFVRDYCMIKRLTYLEFARFISAYFCIADERIHAEIIQALRHENEHVRWIGHAQEILKDIREQECQLVLITNSTQMGWKAADEALGLSREFSNVFLSWERKCAKPNVKVFRTVMSWFPGVAPNRFIMVGDSEEHDLAPARKLGWKTFLAKEGIGHVLD